MFQKGSKVRSMLTGSCPKCQNESMYVNANPYHLSDTMKMNEHCSHCGFKYKVEPNFFFGAMYVSYGLSVMCGIAIFLVCHFLVKTDIKVSFVAILIGLLLLTPWITRLSRNIYINIFVNFDARAGKLSH